MITSSFYTKANAVTPSDTVPHGFPCKAFYIGGAGNLILSINGVNVTFTGVLAGTILPISSPRVHATLTTATGIIALA